MQTNDFLEKSKETCLNKYGVEQYTKTKEFKDYITKNKDKIIAKIQNNSWVFTNTIANPPNNKANKAMRIVFFEPI